MEPPTGGYAVGDSTTDCEGVPDGGNGGKGSAASSLASRGTTFLAKVTEVRIKTSEDKTINRGRVYQERHFLHPIQLRFYFRIDLQSKINVSKPQ